MKIISPYKRYSFVVVFMSLLLLGATSCGDDDETIVENEIPEEELEPIEFDFCLTYSPINFTLPAKITENDNYLQNQYSLELYTSILAANTFLELPGFFVFAEEGKPVDPVLSNDDELTAFEWGSDAGKFTYQYKTVTDEFNSTFYYEVYYQKQGDALPVIFLEGDQEVNCDFGKINAYEFLADEVGERAYYIQWRSLNTTGLEVDYEIRPQDINSRRYLIYQDVPGQQGNMTLFIDNIIDLKIIWQNDGSGFWEQYENNAVVDSGSWSF
jgi:hypothetical protein